MWTAEGSKQVLQVQDQLAIQLEPAVTVSNENFCENSFLCYLEWQTVVISVVSETVLLHSNGKSDAQLKSVAYILLAL